MTNKLIGIAGPNGAGKSTITKLIADENPNVLRIKLDNYSYDPEGFPKIDGSPDWDIPESLNFDLLYKNLSDLKMGLNTEIPMILPKNGIFGIEYKTVEAKPIVLVEGFLLFYDERIRELFNIRIYIDIPDEEVLRRRNPDALPEKDTYIKKVVIPNYRKYGESAKQSVNIVLDGTRPVEELKSKIVDFI